MYEIEFPLGDLDSEAVEAALTEIGASSITFVDRGDEPVLEPKPGEIRLWSDTLVRALFQQAADPTTNVDATAGVDAKAAVYTAVSYTHLCSGVRTACVFALGKSTLTMAG